MTADEMRREREAACYGNIDRIPERAMSGAEKVLGAVRLFEAS